MLLNGRRRKKNKQTKKGRRRGGRKEKKAINNVPFEFTCRCCNTARGRNLWLILESKRCDNSPVRWLVKAVVGMRSGFPSSSSPLPANVAMLGCWGGDFAFAGVAACFLQSAINTPVTIKPNPVAVPPSPIRIGDMSTEDPDSPIKRIVTPNIQPNKYQKLQKSTFQNCTRYWMNFNSHLSSKAIFLNFFLCSLSFSLLSGIKRKKKRNSKFLLGRTRKFTRKEIWGERELNRRLIPIHRIGWWERERERKVFSLWIGSFDGSRVFVWRALAFNISLA